MRVNKYLMIFCLLVTSLWSGGTLASGQERFANYNVDPSLSAMVVDSKNGQILFEQNTDSLVAVGDLTKLLTLYLVMEAVDHGDLTMDSSVPISDQAYQLSQNYDINNVPLRQDYDYKLEDLVQALLVQSANGASLALAQMIEPDEDKFVELMRDQLTEWQEDDFEIYNATGLAKEDLDASLEDNSLKQTDKQVNRMSTEVLATIVYHLLEVYPDIDQYSQKDIDTFVKDSEDAFDMNNANLLVSGGDYDYDLATGLMVDDSQEDLQSIVSTSQRDDLGLIGVSLGYDDPDQMYHAMTDMLQETYSSYRVEKIAKAGDKIEHIGQTRVRGGVDRSVDFKYRHDVSIVVPVIDTAPQMTYNFLPDYQYFDKQNNLMAPVKENTLVGYMKIDALNTPSLGSLASCRGNQAEVTVAKAVDQASSWTSFWRTLSDSFNDLMRDLRSFFVNLFN